MNLNESNLIKLTDELFIGVSYAMKGFRPVDKRILYDYTSARVKKWHKLLAKYLEKGEVMLNIRAEYTTRHNAFLIVFELNIPRNQLRVEEHSHDLKKTIDLCTDKIKLSLQKLKS